MVSRKRRRSDEDGIDRDRGRGAGVPPDARERRLLALQSNVGNAALTALLSGRSQPTVRERPAVAGRPVPMGTGEPSILAPQPRSTAGFSILAQPTVARQAVAPPAVTYPSYDGVQFNGTVRTAMWDAWKETVQTTVDGSRREQGFWIQWNTKTTANANGTYKIVDPVVGGTIPNDKGAVMTPGPKPADAGDWATVGFFHTHTPTRFRAVGRPVGASGADNTFHNGQNVTGIVRDYVGDKHGNAPARHPLWSESKYYPSGPARRT